ncbi:hypothetical protein DVA67_007460 [Solirubrobacter sp. CPCC 204708]|uniref:Uncharacterized protein n=1 Tax=Solirubrobacter deserti TaxID=2282478 RepID=A0ABT4RJY9_9ACTN|nr:hypothetical protein [Solirubrobacter deserti]MBE2315808.1 hypothetical protein [Solirubrobacter deserti]MDA0138856.1 hypothetical protein [Solirubrobacter deserti]
MRADPWRAERARDEQQEGRTAPRGETAVLDPVRPGLAPHSLLALQQGAGNAAVSRMLARFKAPDATASVGGDGRDVTYLPGPAAAENDTLAPGDKGWTLQMLEAVPAASGRSLAYYQDSHLSTVRPHVATLDAQIRTRSGHEQQAREEAGDATFPHFTQVWTERATDCGKHVEQLIGDRATEQRLCERFNAGVPRANQMFVSLARLEAMQEMLGVSSPEAMSTAVIDSLKEAQAVAEKTQLKGSAGALSVPAADQQVADATGELTVAQTTMAAAWTGVQRTLVLDRAAEVQQEGAADAQRQSQIETNIGTWKQVGQAIDVSMAVMGVGVTGATEGGGLRGAMDGVGAPGVSRDPLTFSLTVGEGGVPAGAQEAYAAASGATGLSVPTSAGDVMETAAQIYYFDELKKIRRHLQTLENEVAGHRAVAESLGVSQALQTFSAAVDAFEHHARALKNRLHARQGAYLLLGQQLDEAAQRDPKAARSAPGKGKERFATVMTVTSAVREVLAMGNGARAGFGTDAAGLQQQVAQIVAHRERPVHGYQRFRFPDEEAEPLVSAIEQLRTFEGNFAALEAALGGIETQARTMMTALGRGEESAAAY